METDNSSISVLSRFGLAISLLLIILSLAVYTRLQPELPLFYSLAKTEQALVSRVWIFLLPGISLLINVGHLLFSRLISPKEPHSAVLTFFWGSTFALQILLFSVWLRIIWITW